MNHDTILPEPQQVDPRRLMALLEGTGWHQAGGREGLYSRLAPPAGTTIGRETTLLVPLDDSAPDFSMLMQAAIRSLASLPETTLRTGLLQRLAAVPTDEFRFSKETAAPPGWIAWSQGEELFASARAALAAGAKRFRERSRHYSNRHGRFANRYIESALMGQTSQGSFVIHAYVPTQAEIPVRASVADSEGLPGLSGPTAREISREVIQTVQATREAVDDYSRRGTFEAFEDPEMPVSYEAANAIRTLASGAEAASVEVAWDPGDTAEPPSISRVEFESADALILQQAATRLATPEPKRQARAVGVVHLLTRAEAEGPGVIGLTTIDGEPARKIRVRLSAEDYRLAIRTHDEGAGIELEGTLEREGNLFWLYNARVVRQLTPDEIVTRLARAPYPGIGQVSIEDITGPRELDT